MESSRDSMQSLHVLIYKETDGWNCYEKKDLCARWRNWKRMKQCSLAIKGSKLSSHYHALKEDSVLHPSYSPPHNLWSQYPHPRHVFPLCFHSQSFIINSHILPSLKPPQFPIPSSLLAHTSPDTDLALRFLCLGGVMVVGCLTVRAVVFTVVIGCPGVCHYQQLLDVSLQWGKGDKKTHQWNPLHISWDWILNWEDFFSTCNVFIESDCNQKKEMKESTGIIL